MTTSKDSIKMLELAGQKLSLEGTSGISENSQQEATGEPVFHSASFGGQTLSLKGTSGISKYSQQTAEGKPSYLSMGADSGSGDAGRPTVLRGSAGVYLK